MIKPWHIGAALAAAAAAAAFYASRLFISKGAPTERQPAPSKDTKSKVRPFRKGEVRSRSVSRTLGPSFEQARAELEKENPGYYTFEYDTSMHCGRSHKAILYSDPEAISKSEFDRVAGQMYEKELEEASSY